MHRIRLLEPFAMLPLPDGVNTTLLDQVRNAPRRVSTSLPP
jgi:hypothetical protein